MDNFEEHFTSAVSQACQIHGVASLNDLQRLCLYTLLEDDRRDVLGCFPTGFDKSLIYQVWPTVCGLLSATYPDRWPKETFLLIVCPVRSIMEEQVKRLNEKGLSAAYAGKDKHTDQRICSGDFSFVYGSPETFVEEKFWRLALQRRCERLIGFVVDEVHTVFQWNQEKEPTFRKWCEMVSELRSLLPKAVPLLALTATSTKNLRRQVVKNLGMQKYVEIAEIPDQANIRLAVKKISGVRPSETFAWLIQELESQGPNTEKYVIYCNTIDDCSMLYGPVFRFNIGKKWLFPVGSKDVLTNRVVEMYHSCTPEDVKQTIVHSLQDPASVLRVVVATSALGTGVVFGGVNHVVHYGPPRDIDSYMQACGRAGREGSAVHSLILYHERQLAGLPHQMRQYLTDETTCRRVQLSHLFSGETSEPLPVLHECCSNCATTCDCNETCDGQRSALERHVPEAPASRERTVTPEQRILLQEKLEDMAQDMTHEAEGLYGEVSFYLAFFYRHMINTVLEKSSVLFTLTDVFFNVQVGNVKEALAIRSVLRDVFDDM